MTSALAPDPLARGPLAPAQGRGLRGSGPSRPSVPQVRSRESPGSDDASSSSWRQAWQWPASRQGISAAGSTWASPPGSAAQPTPTEGRSSVSTEQRENLEAILRQSAFPAGIDVSEQRRLLRELISAQPLPADVTVTAAALGGVPTAEITIDGIEPRHVVLYFHGGVYVLGDAFQAAGLASQVGRRTRAKVISVDYRLAPEHPYPAAVDDALAAYEALLRQRHSPVGHRLRGRVRRRRARRRHLGQRPRSRAAPARRGLRHVTVRRPHPGRDDHGHQARGRPADEPGKPPIPGHRLHGGTRRRCSASSARYSPTCPACRP